MSYISLYFKARQNYCHNNCCLIISEKCHFLSLLFLRGHKRRKNTSVSGGNVLETNLIKTGHRDSARVYREGDGRFLYIPPFCYPQVAVPRLVVLLPFHWMGGVGEVVVQRLL